MSGETIFLLTTAFIGLAALASWRIARPRQYPPQPTSSASREINALRKELEA